MSLRLAWAALQNPVLGNNAKQHTFPSHPPKKKDKRDSVTEITGVKGSCKKQYKETLLPVCTNEQILQNISLCHTTRILTLTQSADYLITFKFITFKFIYFNACGNMSVFLQVYFVCMYACMYVSVQCTHC